MKFKTYHLSLLVIAILCIGCSGVRVTTHQRASFNKNATVTVFCTSADPLGLRNTFEHILLSRGYDVVSREIAIAKSKLNVDLDLKNNRVKGGVESYRIQEIPSVYVLSFSYVTYYGVIETMGPLYGSIIDLRTGRVVKSLKANKHMEILMSNHDLLETLVDELEDTH